MAKKRQQPQSEALQRKQASASRSERNARRIILLIFAVLVPLSVVGVLAYGFLVVPRQPVAVVGGEKILLADFQERVRLNFFVQAQSLAGQQGLSIEQAKLQAAQSIDLALLGENTLDQMINEVLVRQYAAERNITASDAETEDQLRQFFGFPSVEEPDPEPTPFPTLFPATPTATATFVYTPTPSPTVEGAPAEATPIPSPTATRSADREARLSTPTVTPTYQGPTEDEEAAFRDAYQTRVAEWSAESGMSEAEIRLLFADQVILDKIYTEVAADVPNTTDEALYAVILVQTEEEALQLLERLEAGENFAMLAAENSLDSATAYKGGLVGWGAREDLQSLAPELADLIFSLPLNEPGGPVQSPQGYILVEVYDRAEDVLLPQVAHFFRQQQEFQSFVTGLRADASENIEVNENWRSHLPELN